MQTFKNTADNQYWQFEDDVAVAQINNGVYTFTAAHGERLNVPDTLVPATMPDPTPAPVVIPQSCTVTQGGLALIAAGLMPAVQAVIDGLRADPVANGAALWAWDKAPTWDRNSSSLKSIAAAAGITDAQMDDLFVNAVAIIP